MEIGIVSLSPNIKNIQYVIDSIILLGHIPYILDLVHSTKEKIYYIIKRSKIKYWIFTGSPLCVVDRRSTQIPLEIYKLQDKKYMMICYSLESIPYQMNLPISIRRTLKKEIFELNVDINNIDSKMKYLFQNIQQPMKLWRNHYGYLSSKININPFTELSSYQGECMILSYRNSILVQFHPERTKDGIQFISNWLS